VAGPNQNRLTGEKPTNEHKRLEPKEPWICPLFCTASILSIILNKGVPGADLSRVTVFPLTCDVRCYLFSFFLDSAVPSLPVLPFGFRPESWAQHDLQSQVSFCFGAYPVLSCPVLPCPVVS
jgi:hypothetical protein